MDATDALLFWINKICLLVRDDAEKKETRLKGTVSFPLGTQNDLNRRRLGARDGGSVRGHLRRLLSVRTRVILCAAQSRIEW